MDPLTIILIALVVAAIGGASVVATRSAGGWGGRVLRSRSRLAPVGGGGERGFDSRRRAREVASPPTGQATEVVAPIVVDPSHGEAAPRSIDDFGRRSSIDRTLVEQLNRIEEQLGGANHQMSLRLEAVRDEVRLGRDSVAAAIATIEARQVTALERLRSDLVGQLSGAGIAAATGDGGLRERRAEATMAIYAGVARLESALAQVTNPILLPGEAYAPPVEFLPEALAWENWKDVGERAFSLADAFSAQRLCLSDQTRQELAAFITTLRGALTRAVYPNLVPDPTPEQLDALRSALGSLAAELPRVRRTLEAEFRSLSSPAPLTDGRASRQN